jgi:hypothetical protein
MDGKHIQRRARIVRHIVRLFVVPLAAFGSGCGGSGTGDPGSSSIRTVDACNADADCTKSPVGYCKDAHSVVYYAMATCDRRTCVWTPTDGHCELACQDGYCVTAGSD